MFKTNIKNIWKQSSRGVWLKKLFWKISQNQQRGTKDRVPFAVKLQTCNLIENGFYPLDTGHQSNVVRRSEDVQDAF